MDALQIARRMAELDKPSEAGQAYTLALHNGNLAPEEELEAAFYLLQSGGDYKTAYTAFLSLYRRGCFQADCLSIMTEAFYRPNVKLLKNRYEKNCKALSRYPYLFRRDFPAFEDLPLCFYPFDDASYLPFDPKTGAFGDYWKPAHQVVSRNFFKDLENPILAKDVYSQYELEYLYDNVRPSEWVARDNHIYLHYADWTVFCAHLQVLNLRRLLEKKKIVFLFGEELSRYPIDFQAEFGVDYSRNSVRPVGISEIQKLIWHTQLATHNGGDFFNEIFDAHPNLLVCPSIMMSKVEEAIASYRENLDKYKNVETAVECMSGLPPSVARELYLMKGRTEKDILVAIFLGDTRFSGHIDANSRIAPALFFQPHFANILYTLSADEKRRTVLHSKQYDSIRSSPLFQGFKYIKTFTPMRRITTSYAASVRFVNEYEDPEKEKDGVLIDLVAERVQNRSFMVDPEDRLYRDSVLVRFEDGKLNPKATFTALAAFLDLPYTESMTYCSLIGERDPESLQGNDLGFSPAAIYRTYDEYANDAERIYIEYFMRDAYEYYGYDFHYYDGQPMTPERIQELLNGFSTIDRYIRESWEKNVLAKATVRLGGEEVTGELAQKGRDKWMEEYLNQAKEGRLRLAEALEKGLHFVNKNGQPLHMTPKLELDPTLLEQPLYH